MQMQLFARIVRITQVVSVVEGCMLQLEIHSHNVGFAAQIMVTGSAITAGGQRDTKFLVELRKLLMRSLAPFQIFQSRFHMAM